jgi:hypothetical protein
VTKSLFYVALVHFFSRHARFLPAAKCCCRAKQDFHFCFDARAVNGFEKASSGNETSERASVSLSVRICVLAGAHLLERRVIKNFRARNPAGARGGAASSEFAKSAHSHKHRARRASVRACDKFQPPECISLSAKKQAVRNFCAPHSLKIPFFPGWLAVRANKRKVFKFRAERN